MWFSLFWKSKKLKGFYYNFHYFYSANNVTQIVKIVMDFYLQIALIAIMALC